MSGPALQRVPASTYRLQVNYRFPLGEAQRLAPYLKRLGISECYCSPLLAAKPGSMHGYDLVDHSRINPEVGGAEGLERFSQALRENDLGLVLDFVPNHMSTDAAANLWWRSVLENGPSSVFANCFDIDWEPVKIDLKNKVLLPVLGDQYGVTLESGQLQIAFDNGTFRLRYFDLDLPLNPRQLRGLLSYDLESLVAKFGPEDAQLKEFQSILFHLENLPAYTETDREVVRLRQRETEVALHRVERLAQECDTIRQHIESNVRRFNGVAGDRGSFDLLHELLDLQPYRLSYWRTAMHEINYRRFFDVNDLAGIRMEDPETFRMAHELVFELIRKGEVTGMRLDHIDGLFDPAGYLEALESAREQDQAIYVVVEKVLSRGEELPAHWKTHGTTGYDFLNDLSGLYVDSRHAHAFRKLYQRFTGNEEAFPDLVYESKKLIIETSMASELNVLAQELDRISERDRRFRDFTLDSLREALREIVALFPVYRSYVGAHGWSELDERNIDLAVSEALIRNPALEPSIFHFTRQMLLPQRAPDVSEEDYQRRLRFSMKFQQYSGPVQAKGVEDTAFYRWGALVSLNEVGGDPDRFGRTVEEFHAANQKRQTAWPLGMLATATHDTKRGEDARARMNVLSEIPGQWRSAISRWARSNASARTSIRGEYAPDRSDEYLYYQALVGSWPLETPTREFVDRMRAYMQKAVREKKIHTSWIRPSDEYDDAVSKFVERSLTGKSSRSFLGLFVPFQQKIARLGMLNSLSQLILKIGSPGVPDIYQGSELWDLNLVDPDNRRPVDFGIRERCLEELLPLLENRPRPEGAGQILEEMLKNWEDGRIKLFCTAAALRLRRRMLNVFAGGEYVPLPAEGAAAKHVVAFGRASGGRRVIVVAPRLVAGLYEFGGSLHPWPALWGDTTLALPKEWSGDRYRNIFTAEIVTGAGNGERKELRLADILHTWPVAMLENDNEDSF